MATSSSCCVPVEPATPGRHPFRGQPQELRVGLVHVENLVDQVAVLAVALAILARMLGNHLQVKFVHPFGSAPETRRPDGGIRNDLVADKGVNLPAIHPRIRSSAIPRQFFLELHPFPFGYLQLDQCANVIDRDVMHRLGKPCKRHLSPMCVRPGPEYFDRSTGTERCRSSSFHSTMYDRTACRVRSRSSGATSRHHSRTIIFPKPLNANTSWVLTRSSQSQAIERTATCRLRRVVG